MASEILNFFHGDELAASVWEKKYKFGNEKTPYDSFKRYCKEIAEKELERANTFTLYPEIDDELSDYGKQRWYKIKQMSTCGNPHSRREMINEHFRNFINFDNIILGGSMLATIGNHKSYSSLSNCFVLGQPYDSYAGINQKSMEMCEVMKRRGGCVEQHTKVIIRGENNERIIKEIKDVKIGDYILSFNVKTGEDEWKQVNDHYVVDVPFEKQIIYKYSDGTYIKTSSTHPVLTILDKQYGYGSFENQTDKNLPNYYEPNILESYNKAPNKNYIEQFWNEELSEIGWLIGAHMGDGTSDIVKNECGSDTTRIRFSKSDKEVVEKYKSIIEKITGSNTKVVLNTSKRYQTEVWSYFSTNKNNSIFIEKYFDSQRNNKTLTAKIPAFIKENNLWIPFIAGLIDTDGFTIDGGKFEITLSNRNVISELTEWIKSINDLCNVTIRTDNRKETFNDSYTLSIYSYSKIYNLIAKYLVNKKRIKEVGKQQSQNFALLNNEIDTVLSFKMSNIKDKTMYDRILGNRKHLKKTHRANLMSLQNYQQFNMFDNNEINGIISRTKLDKVSYDKDEKQVYYDISVEDNNNYYAGNFGFVVIHNCGIDISTLRPDGAAVHNQSNESCGPVLFAERYSFISSEIAQRGRRGALMISINIAHPNALDFIQSKQDLTKITGANISVIVNNEFMKKVIDKKDNYYIQHFPCNVPIESFDLTNIHVEDYGDLIETTYERNCEIYTGYVRIVNAKNIWNKIIHCAWSTAEPGIIFGNNWFEGGTDGVYNRYRAVTTNPCSEIPMQPYDSCRLASINLFGFVKNPFKSTAEFDFERFYKVAYEQVCILDNLVDLEADYINRIIDKINSDKNEPEELREQSITLWKRILNEGKSGRRLGAGFTALGDTLAALGLDYSININTEYFLNKLFECKMRAELDATIDLAVLFGAFDGFDANKEFDENLTGKNVIFQTISENYPEQVKRMMKHGRRNVSWSTAAPTGSLSILTQTTSGVEPLFLPWYERRKKVTSHTERVDYIDPADGNKFTVFFVLHPKFKLWLEMQGINPDNLSKTQLQKLFEQSPWYGSCANDIDWESRVTIQSIVQKYTTHAISSTINLPSDIDEQTISNIYLKSWSSGLKGNTVYRDGSRGGVIVSTDKKQQSDNEFTENRAPKRPKELKAYYHTLQSKGTVYAVIIGLLENKPYEVFITSGLDNLPVNLDEFEDKIEGEIVKEYKNRYDFVCDGFILRDLADVELDEKMVSLMISMGLRHRTPLKFVIKTLEKMQPIAGSFTHRLIKILSKYIPNGEEYVGDKCPDCGDTLRYENGCCICPSCGYTKC